MNCVFIISAHLLCTSAVLSDPLTDDIKEYFHSDSVKTITRVWDDHRNSVEHALQDALQENTKDEVKAFNMKPTDLRLTNSYYHKQGPVEVIFKNLDLVALPRSWMPRVSLSLDSNVLKIETALTKMVINAEYLLMRNRSDMIEDVVNQDPFRYSPFLFRKVRNTGKITIWVDGCILSGYVIARLKGGTVVLGHDKLTLTRCAYTVEIHNKDPNRSPFMVRYSVIKPAYSLGIKHYLLKAIKNKFLVKLQSTIFCIVNTSAIFRQNLPVYEKKQKVIFLGTLSNLTSLIKEQNRKIIMHLNGGTVDIPDYMCTWDDMDTSNKEAKLVELKLSKMVLSGLGTAIYSLTGGPYKYNTMMIGEQKRFSNLQVRGEIPSPTQNGNTLKFSVKISNFAINVDIDIEGGGSNQAKIEVVGYRHIKFDQPGNISTPLQTLITGYLMDAVPKAIITTITAVANMPVPAPVTKPQSQSTQLENSDPGTSFYKYTRSNMRISEIGVKSKFKKRTYKRLLNNEI